MKWIPTRIVQSVTRDRDVSVLMSGRNAFPVLEIQLYFADDFFSSYYICDAILQSRYDCETGYIFSSSLHFSNQLQILISGCKLYSARLVERNLNLSPFGVSPSLQDCVILLGLVQY